ncbi:natural cytotoxicity triggering receptor 3 ligand 1-like [Hyla sarda]|uniref:natural cytotoxicity triggering receptor 3 ligand 1-like n=1 Tax=Hyla sarda TaxID=327740 RepID=UPI0024C42D6D|nr:natural cytotoxicity triggering receptor 3 ligand 1-like [Hyla sarda]
MLLSTASTLQLTGPSVYAAKLGSDARVPCLFRVDYPPVDPELLRIFWIFQDKEVLSYDKTVRNKSRRYSLSTKAIGSGIANLTISNIQIPDGGMYKCSVTYRSETKDKEVRLDIGAPPQVKIIQKTVVMNKKSVLSCSITGFYPIDIDIRWFRDGDRLADNVIIGDPWRNPDRTYNVTSTLTITPTEGDRDRNFSCRVRHEYLQEPVQEDFRLVYEGKLVSKISFSINGFIYKNVSSVNVRTTTFYGMN